MALTHYGVNLSLRNSCTTSTQARRNAPTALTQSRRNALDGVNRHGVTHLQRQRRHGVTHLRRATAAYAISRIFTPRSANPAMYSPAGMHSSGVCTPGSIFPIAWSCPVIESEYPVVRIIALIPRSAS